MNKRIFSSVLLLLLFLVPLVLAEDKYVEDGITVKLDKGNLTILTNSILESSKKFEITGINENTTLDNTYDWIIKTSLECTSEGLINYTKEMTETCNDMGNLAQSCIATLGNITTPSLIGFNFEQKYADEVTAHAECRVNRDICEKERDDTRLDSSHLIVGMICVIAGIIGTNAWKKRKEIAKVGLGKGLQKQTRHTEIVEEPKKMYRE